MATDDTLQNDDMFQNSDDTPQNDNDAPAFDLSASRQFNDRLIEQRLSLAFTTYQSGKLFLLGMQPDDRLSVFERTFNRSMAFAPTGKASI